EHVRHSRLAWWIINRSEIYGEVDGNELHLRTHRDHQVHSVRQGKALNAGSDLATLGPAGQPAQQQNRRRQNSEPCFPRPAHWAAPFRSKRTRRMGWFLVSAMNSSRPSSLTAPPPG